MNSNCRQNVNDILDEVFERLSERHLSETIDTPIDTAAASFRFGKKAPMTHDYFIEIISRFVGHVYQQGLSFRQKLSQTQAHFEATALLENGYQNSYGKGYHAAYLDALSDIEPVLAQISDHLKMISRVRYGRCVYSTYIDPSDWPAKCRIAEALINRFTSLPRSLAGFPPARFVDHIPQIINIIISSKQTAYNLLSAGIQDGSA